MENHEWRILDLKFSSYAAATPLVSSLMELKAKDEIPNTLAFIAFQQSSVCLFYYNDPEKEIDMEFCRENRIEFSRRDTGGSPYWADPGTLLVYLYFNRRQVAGFPDTISGSHRFLIGAAARAFSERFKVSIVYRPLNDMEVGGKKIAGHTVTFVGDTCRWGCGPQILKPRMDLMSRALKVPPEKFSDKEAKTVEARVTNFEELLGRPPDFGEIKGTYVSAMEKALQVRFQPGTLSTREEALMQEQKARIFSDSWIMAMTERKKFGERIPPGWRRGEEAVKIPQGPLIRAILFLEGGIIRNLSLTGSVHCTPVRLLEEMEADLRGVSAGEEEIRRVVRRHLDRPGVQTANCTAEDFVRVIGGALAKAGG